MNSRQDHILKIFSSIAVGTMAFCLTVLAAMLFGSKLFAPWLKSDRWFPPQFVFLVLVSLIAGVVVGVGFGTKYYHRLEKKHGQ